MTIKVAVLGCGPAGLMAAWGAQSVTPEAHVRVFSRFIKSDMFGAQYLHKPIPGVPVSESITVRYTLDGTAEGYRDKVYGRMPFIGDVSVEALEPDHEAWDIRETYDWLWDVWREEIADVQIDPEGVERILDMADIVINTIPAPALCWQGHSFRAQEIWAAGSAPTLGISIPYYCPPDTVICNGNETPTWYRISNIFDHKTVEWSLHSMPNRPPVGKPSLVPKPIDHNCTCWPRLLSAGRYGMWKKGILSHEAYDAARKAVEHAMTHDNATT